MAFQSYTTVTGKKQGALKGEAQGSIFHLYATFRDQAQDSFAHNTTEQGWFPCTLPRPGGITVNAKQRFCASQGPLAIHIPLTASGTMSVRDLVRARSMDTVFKRVTLRLVPADSRCNGKVFDDLEMRNVAIRTMTHWIDGTEMVIRLVLDVRQIQFTT
jgi:hypothetical protein